LGDEGKARIRLDSGTFQTLNLDKSTDQHLRHGCARQKVMYAAISRSRTSAAVYTDDRAMLVSAINERVNTAQSAALCPPCIPQTPRFPYCMNQCLPLCLGHLASHSLSFGTKTMTTQSAPDRLALHREAAAQTRSIQSRPVPTSIA
jgi:hypothetical protein